MSDLPSQPQQAAPTQPPAWFILVEVAHDATAPGTVEAFVRDNAKRIANGLRASIESAGEQLLDVKITTSITQRK